METLPSPARRIAWLEAGAGTVCWGVLGFTVGPTFYDPVLAGVHRPLSLLLLVAVPLVLGLAEAPDRTGRHPRPYRWAVLLWLPAAPCAGLALVLPAGGLAALLTLPWLAFSAAAAVFGLVRLLPRGFVRAEEVCMDAGLLFLPGGAVWLTLSRAGLEPFGFVEPLVALTAAHFHAAGCATPILAGCVGRAWTARRGTGGGLFTWLAVGVIAGTPLVAAGITVDGATEAIAAGILAVVLLDLAALVLVARLWRVADPLAAGCLVLGHVALIASMSLAVVYATGTALDRPLLGIPAMVRTHAWLNVAGFVVLAAVGWMLARPASHVRPGGIPFSRLRARGRIGADVFHRLGAVPDRAEQPAGMLDDIRVHAGAGFDPSDLHPAIRAFYERTGEHRLLVRPRWRPGLRPAGRLYQRWSARVEQMNLPVGGADAANRLDSRIFALDEQLDGRAGARAWVRTYTATGKALYAAAYGYHRDATRAYMDIAFPHLGGNVTSILRFESLPQPGAPSGLVLTTFPERTRVGDEGVYVVTPWLPIRAPMNETIGVWAADAPGTPFRPDADTAWATVVARHDIWVFGAHCLTLDYFIAPVRPASGTAAPMR